MATARASRAPLQDAKHAQALDRLAKARADRERRQRQKQEAAIHLASSHPAAAAQVADPSQRHAAEGVRNEDGAWDLTEKLGALQLGWNRETKEVKDDDCLIVTEASQRAQPAWPAAATLLPTSGHQDNRDACKQAECLAIASNAATQPVPEDEDHAPTHSKWTDVVNSAASQPLPEEEGKVPQALGEGDRGGRDDVPDYMLGGGAFRLPGAQAEKLFPHQKKGLEWLWGLHVGKQGGVLGDDMVRFSISTEKPGSYRFLRRACLL